RKQKGIWGTTVANAWGTVAMARFSERFEKVPASGTVEARIAEHSVPIGVLKEKQIRDLAWPKGRESLSLSHAGAGAPWTIVQSRAAIPLKAPLSSGYSIRRSIVPVEKTE